MGANYRIECQYSEWVTGVNTFTMSNIYKFTLAIFHLDQIIGHVNEWRKNNWSIAEILGG